MFQDPSAVAVGTRCASRDDVRARDDQLPAGPQREGLRIGAIGLESGLVWEADDMKLERRPPSPGVRRSSGDRPAAGAHAIEGGEADRQVNPTAMAGHDLGRLPLEGLERSRFARMNPKGDHPDQPSCRISIFPCVIQFNLAIALAGRLELTRPTILWMGKQGIPKGDIVTRFSLVLLPAVAAALMSGCSPRDSVARMCTDGNGRRVEDNQCQTSGSRGYVSGGFYHWYYLSRGGAQPAAVGDVVSNGSYSPPGGARSFSSVSERGGFGAEGAAHASGKGAGE